MTTNNDAPVCECGCPLTRHVRFTNGVLACAAGCPNSCEEFTDARLAVLRAENERLEGHRATLKDMLLRETRKLEEARLAHVKTAVELRDALAEIARLTPRMVRDLPKVKGWYWRIVDGDSEIEIVHVRQDLDGGVYLESTDDDGTLVINLVLHGKLWSAEPIPMPVIEKEGEI